MKFSHEEKRTPTLRKWVDATKPANGGRYPIVRVLINSEWRTVTFCTDEFRINLKFETNKEFEGTERGLRKILDKHCRAYVDYTGGYKSEIEVVPASDADESPDKFNRDDFGYVKA